MTQQCFIGDDGYMYCNGIFKNKSWIPARGKWFRFVPKQKKGKADQDL